MTEVAKWIVEAFENKTPVLIEYPLGSVVEGTVLSVTGRIAECPVIVESEHGTLGAFTPDGKSPSIPGVKLIPPEPKPMEFWVTHYDDGCLGGVYSSFDAAVAMKSSIRVGRIVHVREVVPDAD